MGGGGGGEGGHVGPRGPRVRLPRCVGRHQRPPRLPPPARRQQLRWVAESSITCQKYERLLIFVRFSTATHEMKEKGGEKENDRQAVQDKVQPTRVTMGQSLASAL